MATRPLQRFRSEITCPECDEFFNDPVTLSCLHTYCRRCLKELLEENGEPKEVGEHEHVHGPENGEAAKMVCKQENLKNNACDPVLCTHLKNMKAADVKDLPTNHCFENIIQHINREDAITSEEGTKRCDVCVREPPAVHYCKECQKALCEKCKEHHTDGKETAQHKVQSIDDIRTKSKSGSFSGVDGRVTWKCHKHPKQDVRFYCFEHDELICSDCAITNHNTCNKEMSDKVFQRWPELKAKLVKQIDSSKEVHGKFEAAISDIDAMRKTLQESKDRAKQAIEKRHREMVEELERQKEQLLCGADEIYECKDKNLEEQLGELQRISAAVRNPIDLSNEILGIGIPEEILYFRAMLQTRLEQLCEDYGPYNRDPRDSDIIAFTSNTKLDLTAAVGTVVGDPHISQFTIDDPPLKDLHLIRCEEASFKVTSRDIVGSPLTETPHDNVIVELQAHGEGGDVVGGNVRKEKGFYSVTVTPQQTGKHTLQIYVNIRDTRIHIQGSPFEVNVVPKIALEHEREIKRDNLKNPWGIAVSSDKKQIVVSDVTNHHLVLFNENYEVVQIIGKEGDGELEFRSPRGVAFNPVSGEVVVVEKENHRIQILSAEGEFRGKFGEKGGERGQFFKPTCVVVNKEGHIFVTDQTNQRIQYFKPDGTCLGVIGGEYGQTPGTFNDPYAIALDDQEQVYVTEFEGSRIQVFRKGDGGYQSVLVFPKTDFGEPVGIAYDEQSRYIFVCEQTKHCVSVFSRTGRFFSSYGSMGVNKDQFKNPMSVAVLGGHRLMVADCFNNRLVIFRY